MKTQFFILLLLSLFFIGSLAEAAQDNTQLLLLLDSNIKKLEQEKVRGKTDFLESILSEHAVFMPEYQSTLNGKAEILSYYTILNDRQDLLTVEYSRKEIFFIKDLVIEIGNFTQKIRWKMGSEDLKDYEGKYWRVWIHQNQQLVLRTEAFGFFSPIEHPEYWVTNAKTKGSLAPNGFHPKNTSVELKAYHVLGQKGVKEKNGALRASLYATDSIYYPFADKPIIGIDVLLPYLIEYSSHDAIIDSVQTHVHDVLYLEEYILEYSKFAVAWRYDGVPGNSSGKGIKLRKRTKQGELRIYRQIGLHNY